MVGSSVVTDRAALRCMFGSHARYYSFRDVFGLLPVSLPERADRSLLSRVSKNLFSHRLFVLPTQAIVTGAFKANRSSLVIRVACAMAPALSSGPLATM